MKFLLKAVLFTTLILLTGCSGKSEVITEDSPEYSMIQNVSASSSSDSTQISLDFEKQSGYYSNQYAIWIEDSNGEYIKTLFATKFTADGGYKNRPESIPTWVGKSGLASASSEEVDAISGATPQTGSHSYIWDYTDINGERVPDGQYQFFVEGTLRKENRVVFNGVIELDSNASEISNSDILASYYHN